MVLPTLDPTLEFDIISSIINTVGRDVTITYLVTRTACVVCGGNDPFCSTCLGNPTVDTIATRTLKANIRWKGSDRKLYAPEGQFMDGDCIINFSIDAAERYDITDILLKKIISVTVDARECVMQNWYFKGSPINRCYLVLKQDSTVGGQRIG